MSKGVEMVRKIRKREEVEIQREIFGMAMEEDLERGGNISFIPFQKKKRCGNIWNGDGRRF